MPPLFQRGRLPSPADAPLDGERFERLAAGGGAVVEHILSSSHPEPGTYRQDHDELVVVLAGSATLELDGPAGPQAVDLVGGDWALLPAGLGHRVVRTEAGTSWLAVHLPP